MAIIRLGKTREATGFTSERYKSAIRKYLEAMGYAQLTDSRYEGHLSDMVFRPLGNAPWPEVRVESKATELSLSASGLASEIRTYLKDWLSSPTESRFKFMIFAKKLINPSRWDSIWGDTLSQSEALNWLTTDLEEASAGYFTEPGRVKEVGSFFSEASVVEGNDVDLIDMAEEKRKVVLSANEIRQRALRQLSQMDQRSRPIPKKSELIGNLLHFTPPSSYAVLGVGSLTFTEIRDSLRGRDCPPYRVIQSGELVTLNDSEADESFGVLNPTRLRNLGLSELDSTYPGAVAELTNFAIGKMLRRLGVAFFNNKSYFLAQSEAKAHKSRILELSSGEYMHLGELNYVFHQAFSLRYRKLWDQHFIQLKLGKLYTKDGSAVIEGTRAARLDARFRNPVFDRPETRQRKLEKLAEFVFHDKIHKYPPWARMFSFGDFLRISTEWTPDAVPLDQSVIDDFDFRIAGEEEDDLDPTS
ncbi:hypothetical protein E6H37_02545 [Candidatus Bathyarchaeota archaeon]|nr:MAG: hypothetical protein E6H37_02545 [Candidatus Bathyarchaeota archaeon]